MSVPPPLSPPVGDGHSLNSKKRMVPWSSNVKEIDKIQIESVQNTT